MARNGLHDSAEDDNDDDGDGHGNDLMMAVTYHIVKVTFSKVLSMDSNIKRIWNE